MVERRNENGSNSLDKTLKKDFGRVKQSVHSKARHSAKTGYVLVYSEAVQADTLTDRFKRMSDEEKFSLVCRQVLRDNEKEGGWVGAFALFRAASPT